MKKLPRIYILLLSLCIGPFIHPVKAQITINRTDFAVSGTGLDSAAWRLMTKTGAVLPTLGNNQIWDYTELKDSTKSIYTYYHTPAATFGAIPAVFADATYAYNLTTAFQSFQFQALVYEKLDATGYVQLGYTSADAKYSLANLSGGATDSIYFPASIFRFSSPQVYYKFPMTANSVWKTNYKDTTNLQLSVSLLGLNKAPGMRVAQYAILDTIVGWGTLKLKNPSGGTALNFAVLLQRDRQTRLDSFFLGGAPAPAVIMGALGLTQGAITISPTYYTFQGIGFNEPFLWMSTNAAGTVTFVTRAVLPNLGLTTDSREIPDYAVATTVFPNPTTEGVNFEFQKTSLPDWNVMIYNTAGQIVSVNRVSAPQGIVNQHITLASLLPSGTYFYNLLDETSLIRANGKFVVNH
jgi:Secretion system C-terminal sorting domain